MSRSSAPATDRSICRWARFFGYVRRQQAIARVTPPGTAPSRYPPPDPLLAFLDGP